MSVSLLFVCDLNDHHPEWLGSMNTNHHGVAAFDVATVSSCDQSLSAVVWNTVCADILDLP